MDRVRQEKRATLVFGAGLSIALGGTGATWTALLDGLVSALDDRHAATYKHYRNRWVGAEALSHRVHTIRSLAHGDSDAALASTFLMDRIHAVHSRSGGWSAVGRYEDVNKAAQAIEAKWLSRAAEPHVARWNKALAALGNVSREGRSFLVTTNFDHCIATAASLPVFLGGWMDPFNRLSTQHYYGAQPKGSVIRAGMTQMPALWRNGDVLSSNALSPSPSSFADALRKPATIPAGWWQDLASVFHVHGSRLVPPSLVFDACSYGKLCEGAPSITSGEILRSLLESPWISGPVIFVGCKGTLLDPHFIRYWSTSAHLDHFYVLQRKPEIDPLKREMNGHFLDCPPKFCSTGHDHGGMLTAMEKIVAALA